MWLWWPERRFAAAVRGLSPLSAWREELAAIAKDPPPLEGEEGEHAVLAIVGGS